MFLTKKPGEITPTGYQNNMKEATVFLK